MTREAVINALIDRLSADGGQQRKSAAVVEQSVIARLANMPARERNRMLAVYRPSNKRGGRPRSRLSGQRLLDVVEELRAHFEKRDGKKYSDRALLKTVRAEDLARNSSPRQNATSEAASLKTLLNRISIARAQARASRKP
jgi:hypothetical protein